MNSLLSFIEIMGLLVLEKILRRQMLTLLQMQRKVYGVLVGDLSIRDGSTVPGTVRKYMELKGQTYKKIELGMGLLETLDGKLIAEAREGAIKRGITVDLVVVSKQAEKFRDELFITVEEKAEVPEEAPKKAPRKARSASKSSEKVAPGGKVPTGAEALTEAKKKPGRKKSKPVG